MAQTISKRGAQVVSDNGCPGCSRTQIDGADVRHVPNGHSQSPVPLEFSRTLTMPLADSSVPVAPRKREGSVRSVPKIPPAPSSTHQQLCARLSVLEAMRDGWLDGSGVAPSKQAVAIARTILCNLAVEHPELPRPGVFPTPEGGIQAEWVFGAWAADVIFDSETGDIEADASNAQSGEERSGAFTAHDVGPLSDWLISLE